MYIYIYIYVFNKYKYINLLIHKFGFTPAKLSSHYEAWNYKRQETT